MRSVFSCVVIRDLKSSLFYLAALLCMSSWCLVIVVWLFLAVPGVCLQFVIVVFPDHTHLLLLSVLLVTQECHDYL